MPDSILHYMAITVATALVGSRLDYANSDLYGITQENTSIPQNLLARVMFNTHQSNSHTLLQQLHWLLLNTGSTLTLLTLLSMLCITVKPVGII